MKKIFALGVFLILPIMVHGNFWVQKANVGGLPRADATGFSLNGKAYMGTGYAGTYQSDWWEYDPATDSWSQKASYPGGGIVEAVSFTIGNYGYVVASPSSNDVYRYDPLTNTWTAMAPFPGGPRQAAVSFSIGNKGYVSTGMWSTSYNDLWEYDAISNTWTQKSNLPGLARHYACGFSIGNKAYLGTGIAPGASLLNDFWEWDQATDTWTAKANVPGMPRVEASAFAIGNKGYLGMGSGFGSYYDDFYEYDPVTNVWTAKASYGGGPTEEATQFTIGAIGYVGTGYDGVQSGVVKNDFWAYVNENNPSALVESGLDIDFNAYPNPAMHHFSLQLSPNNQMANSVNIYDITGQLITSFSMNNAEVLVDCADWPAGNYIVRLKMKNQTERALLVEKR